MTDPNFRSDMTVEVTDTMGDDLTPVRAARLSTGTQAETNPERDRGLLKALMRDGHHVPFEHQVMSFRIEAPIFVTRQMLKHRISSISEASGRYSEMDGVFYVPAEDRPVKQVGKTMDYQFEEDEPAWWAAQRHLKNGSADSWWRYTEMLNQGVAKEVARMVLPTNLYSTLWITMNSRSLMNFFSLRSSYGEGHPQHEIRDVADSMYDMWFAHFPETASAWYSRSNA